MSLKINVTEREKNSPAPCGEESNPILSSAPLSSLKSTEGDETSDMHAGEGERWMMEMEAVFNYFEISKILQDFSSHRIFICMYGESRTAGELCYSAIL
jgi:hypothetical protein